MLVAAAFGASAQTPGSRVTYRVQVLERAGADPARTLANGTISGPEETNLRLRIATDTAEVLALLDLFPGPDTVGLTGEFHTRRRAGRSPRGLPLWEEDDYRRAVRFPWGATVRLYPFGPGRSAREQKLWVAITVTRDLVGGNTRPQESIVTTDSSVRVTMEAVVHPRRAAVRLTLLRGDTASAPKVFEMVTDAPGRLVTFVLGKGSSRTLELTLTSPEPVPNRSSPESAPDPDADVVCLRVVDPATAGPARTRCGRLNNVARRLALSDGDSLLATFAWPAPR